jgi:hypothetical protein
VLLEGDFLAARNFGQSFVDIGFRPGQIVALVEGALGQGLVDELPGRIFDGSKIVARHVRFNPGFLLGIQRYRHGSSYHKAP